jgi:hypothetical protein
MVDLVHEVWIDENDEGQSFESCCLAGPDGDAFRKLLSPSARLVHTFTAGCHFEAMTLYHRFLDREPYTTDQPSDHLPYPAAWRERQLSPG